MSLRVWSRMSGCRLRNSSAPSTSFPIWASTSSHRSPTSLRLRTFVSASTPAKYSTTVHMRASSWGAASASQLVANTTSGTMGHLLRSAAAAAAFVTAASTSAARRWSESDARPSDPGVFRRLTWLCFCQSAVPPSATHRHLYVFRCANTLHLRQVK